MFLGTLINNILDGLPADTASGNGERRTLGFVRSLLENPPSHLGPEEEAAVEALARKIDVVKKVVRSYDNDWKKPIDGTALDDQEMKALVLMFLFAAGTANREDRDSAGRRLKWLNSGFNAIDLMPTSGKRDSRLAALRNILGSQLEFLLSK